MAIDKKAIKDFAKRWKGIGYEKGDTQKNWLQLLQALGYTNIYDVDFEDHLKVVDSLMFGLKMLVFL